jgi:hypothetical protein
MRQSSPLGANYVIKLASAPEIFDVVRLLVEVTRQPLRADNLERTLEQFFRFFPKIHQELVFYKLP